MSDVVITESYLEDIADAIRDRNGTNNTYKIYEMDEAIKDLHNVILKKWVRPSDWPDYSTIEIGDNEEVIYLTYDASYDHTFIHVIANAPYTIQKGLVTNGVFVGSGNATDCSANEKFQEALTPINNHDFICYKIVPQSGNTISKFWFAPLTNENTSQTITGLRQPCLERYCRLPSWTGIGGGTSGQYWHTTDLIADTVIGASPTSLSSAYNNNAGMLCYCDLSKCSFANVTTLYQLFGSQANLIEYYLPHDLGTNCTSLSGSFYNCQALQFIDVSGWDTSNVTSFNAMFSGCRGLIEIKGVEDFDVSSTTTLASMFSSCNVLRKLDISKWETTSSLTNLSSTFYALYQIEELDVSGFNTENVTDFSSCFNSCNKLKSLDLRNWSITSKVTKLNSMFAYCYSLASLLRNKDWNTSNVTTFEAMFTRCKMLREHDLSDFVFTKATTIKDMFSYNFSVKKIKATFNLPVSTNMQGFSNCYLLNDLSELSFTNCQYMPNFGYCYNITYLTIPTSVTSISSGALRDLAQCEVLDFHNLTAVPTLSAATDITNGMNTKLKIVVPDDLYSTWIAATNWSNSNISSKIITYSDYQASLS